MKFVACIAFLLTTTATLSASPTPDSSASGLWKVEGDVSGQPDGPQNSAPSTPSAPPADGSVTPGQTAVTGTWKIDGDVQGTPVKLTCVLTQTEGKLGGTCSGADGDKTERSITGDSTAKGVTWHFNAEYQGQPITVALTATLNADGNKLTGTIAVAPFDADGTFVGVKQ